MLVRGKDLISRRIHLAPFTCVWVHYDYLAVLPHVMNLTLVYGQRGEFRCGGAEDSVLCDLRLCVLSPAHQSSHRLPPLHCQEARALKGPF